MSVTDDTVADLVKKAKAVCRQAGYPVEDPDYGSAIGWGVFKAIQEDKRDNVEGYAILLAKRQCFLVARSRRRDSQHDRIRASRPMGAPPVPTPIPLEDFEILSFVAARGKSAAVRLLFPKTPFMTGYRRLLRILDDIAIRVKQDPWAKQEVWLATVEEDW